MAKYIVNKDGITATDQETGRVVKISELNKPKVVSVPAFNSTEVKPSIGSSISNAFKGGIEQAKSGYARSKQGVEEAETGNFLKGSYNAISGATEMVAGGIGAAFSPLAPVSKVIEPVINYSANKISANKSIQKFADSRAGEITERIVNDINNLNAILGTVAGSRTLAGTSNYMGKINTALSSMKGKIGGGGTLGNIGRIPNRIATNIAEGQAKKAAINELPTQSFRNAAKEGIEVADLKSLTQIPKIQRRPLKELYDNVKDVNAGKMTTDKLFENVGKPMITRLKTIDNQVKGYATQLDKVADTLKGQGVRSRYEVINTIDDSLDSMGIQRSAKGLDFKGSNLEGLGANEKIINNVYNRLVKARDAYDFHRLKKYIDNNVDFGKRGEGFTGEAERLLKGWRKEIDGALDADFPAYNTVNTKLSERINPLNELKDILKNSDKMDADLLAQKAGILARRITSAAPSNPQIKQILRNLDKFATTKGKTLRSTEALQDFYNILNKYYDIAPKTGFQNLVKEGVESTSSLTGFVTDKLKALGGKTNAVRQKALEQALDDLFKN